MLYPISLHMGISIGWHLPSPGRSMSMELIPAQRPLSPQSTSRGCRTLLAAGPIAAAAAARAPGVRPELGSRRRSHLSGCCPGRHRYPVRPARGGSAAGGGGAQVTIARARQRGRWGGNFPKSRGKRKYPQSTDAQHLLRGARQLSFPWAFTFTIRLSTTLPPPAAASSEHGQNDTGAVRVWADPSDHCFKLHTSRAACRSSGFPPGIFLSLERVTAPDFLAER